jgi:rhodanese-related sulfurtransferase
MKKSLSTLFFLTFTTMLNAQNSIIPPAKVSFEDFKRLVSEVEIHRSNHLIDLDTFLKMSKEKNVIILDTRSAFRYDRKHLAGAINLSFPDFTETNLAQVIPSFGATVLIYCNNNFEGDEIDFATKKAGPSPQTQSQLVQKPIMLALNIPTYINLYGYGYRNIYELAELVNVNDPRVKFDGSVVQKK